MGRTVVILGIVVVAVYVLITAFVAVDVTENVIITQFGKPVRVFTEPGFQVKWPDPVETVIRLDKRLRPLESYEDPPKGPQDILRSRGRTVYPTSHHPYGRGAISSGAGQPGQRIRTIISRQKQGTRGKHPLKW